MMDSSGTRKGARLQLESSTVPGSSYIGRDGRLGLRNVLARRRRCDHRGAGLCVRCAGYHGDIVYVGIVLRRADQPTLAQKSRYPRSRSSCQSTNSSHRANLPSSRKRKTSSSSSYKNSEVPFSQRYISRVHTTGHSYLRSEVASGASPGFLLRRFMDLRVHTLARLRAASISKVAHFLGGGVAIISATRQVVRWVLKRRSTTDRSDVTKRRINQEQSETLEAAGWRLKETGGGKRLWERPDSGYLYPQTAAYWLVKRQERNREDTA
jgi:hypothetical protein